MPSIIKTLVGFLTISSMWLLPVILPEIQAQQTVPSQSRAARSPAITIQELKSRRLAIEGMTDIDATVKTDSLKYIDGAITYIKLAGKYEGYQSRLKALEEEFETAKKRVESAVLTEAIGLALRSQRLKLPRTDRYLAGSDARQIRMSEISEKQIELDQLLRELSDPKVLADRMIGSVSFLSDVDRKAFDLKIRELVAQRNRIAYPYPGDDCRRLGPQGVNRPQQRVYCRPPDQLVAFG